MSSAVVVFSGGQDSTTCLCWAKRRFESVTAITFDYGQRHLAEIRQAKEISELLDIDDHHIIDLTFLKSYTENALTRTHIPVSSGIGNALPSTFVDGRNMMFLTMAAIYAKQINAKHIVTGVCQTDFSGYPDCRDTFIKSLNVTLNLSMDYDFIIETPLMWLNKAETWALADELGALEFIREHTVTCYEGIKGDGCGECPACVLRLRGLDQYYRHLSASKEGLSL